MGPQCHTSVITLKVSHFLSLLSLPFTDAEELDDRMEEKWWRELNWRKDGVEVEVLREDRECWRPEPLSKLQYGINITIHVMHWG